MQTRPLAPFARLLPGSRRTHVVFLAFALAAAIASTACFGDDDEDEPAATLTAGAVATATATVEPAGPTAAPTSASGSLIPGATLTPAPTLTNPPASTGALQSVALYDLEPCGDQAHFEEILLSGGVPALTYKEVPTGTPILFPFESGSLRHVDAKEGAISLTYDVEDVGVVTFKAAGSTSLLRNLREPVAGTVIGEFGTVFGDEDRPELAELQLIAVAGTEELILAGDQYYAGRPLVPEVTDCLPLP